MAILEKTRKGLRAVLSGVTEKDAREFLKKHYPGGEFTRRGYLFHKQVFVIQ